MNCKRCGKQIEDDSIYCRFCGRKQIAEKRARVRGNGQGTVYKDGDKYRAVVVLGYWLDENGKRHRKTASGRYKTKSAAVAALPELMHTKPESNDVTFRELYEKWLPTHDAGKDTMNCYKAAFKYFQPLWFTKMKDIEIDDLQDCIDNCGHGKRTQQNMRAVCGLVYKYGIPRNKIPSDRNLALFLKVSGEDPAPRESFTDEQLRSILSQVGKTWGAEYVYSLCYLGFRPSEFLALKKTDYDTERQVITGGAKTEAGRGRKVTVSPKIKPLMEIIVKRASETLVVDKSGAPYTLSAFTENVFYPVLQTAKIDNPVEDGRHKYTPHSCRHTFATLMKRIPGADKDKLELIGHTSTEMLRYYQDVELDDLRKITDAI